MKSIITEKRFLQFVVAAGCIVPTAAGFSGAVFGVDILRGEGVNLDSHFRYLSGLLLGIGICFMASVPKIETHKKRFQLLTFIVIIGGLGRLAGVIFAGLPNTSMLAALFMELCFTPLVYLWQIRIARLTDGS